MAVSGSSRTLAILRLDMAHTTPILNIRGRFYGVARESESPRNQCLLINLVPVSLRACLEDAGLMMVGDWAGHINGEGPSLPAPSKWLLPKTRALNSSSLEEWHLRVGDLRTWGLKMRDRSARARSILDLLGVLTAQASSVEALVRFFNRWSHMGFDDGTLQD
jgi:hypothetical protein